MDGVAACGVGICFNKYMVENSDKILVQISCEHLRIFWLLIVSSLTISIALFQFLPAAMILID